MSKVAEAFLPGAAIGVLGSGQLGRMLAVAAQRMGYVVHVFSPEENTPAGQVANFETTASYTDIDALARFASTVDVVTIEFENIPVNALKALEQHVPVYPQSAVLYITQNRLREKVFLNEIGIPVVPFEPVQNEEELIAGCESLGFPLVLKTAGFGYDGKGQAKVHSLAEAQKAYQALGDSSCVLEAFIDLEREVSVIAARTETEFAVYRTVENRHCNHILEVTLAPAQLSNELEAQASQITRHIMESLNVRGLLCVEFFITQEGRLLVNELAPRPHNSGHYTIEGALCSQFEQQLRAVCGLPLGDTTLRSSAAMLNVLGDCWANGEPDWQSVLSLSSVYLHLYGKPEPRPGRKMGHITALGETSEEALVLLRQAETRLGHLSVKRD